MVRVAGLREQAFNEMLPQDPPADGLKPIAQLQRIARRTEQLVAQQYGVWNESILPALANAGIRIHTMKDLDAKGVKSLDKYFRQEIFPVLTPMAIDPSHPSPRFQSWALSRGNAGARQRNRAVAVIRRRAGAAGVAAVCADGAGGKAKLCDARGSD